MNYQYPLSSFLADVKTIEELKVEWSSDIPFDKHIARYFHEVHGESDYAAWRYEKYMVVSIYVSKNIGAFGDLAVVGEEEAVVKGRLFGPVLEYAVKHDISDIADFPEPQHFHDAT